MGLCASQEEKKERYRVKHHIPHDEISKKRSMERQRSSNSAKKSMEQRCEGGSGSQLGGDRSGKHDAKAKDIGDKSKDKASVAASGQIANYKPKRPKLDPKDFQFKDLKGEVVIKPAGSINGQAFTIDTCEDCDLYIIDCCAQVTIDKAKNCRIFIGPTEGSVFIRDSVNCQMAVVCRQLRTRDCVDIDVALFCRTRPVIEASTDMRFTCFDLNYEALAPQMKAAKLDALHNFWSHVYDFTPATGKAANWSLLGPEASVESLLGSPELPEKAAEALGKVETGALLVTWGDRSPAPSPDYVFILFPPKAAEAAGTWVAEARSKGVLLRANKVVLEAGAAGNIAATAGWQSKDAKLLSSGGPCVGFELSGSKCAAALSPSASAAGALISEEEDAGRMFRYTGLEG
ncbi:hypothetical protein FOA52_015867 [Chlamydomonas sp. UWO 241]|nr:hypothetical protein FOA52_015867 [Chlamydomonas sp. UWO 241]